MINVVQQLDHCSLVKSIRLLIDRLCVFFFSTVFLIYLFTKSLLVTALYENVKVQMRVGRVAAYLKVAFHCLGLVKKVYHSRSIFKKKT